MSQIMRMKNDKSKFTFFFIFNQQAMKLTQTGTKMSAYFATFDTN